MSESNSSFLHTNNNTCKNAVLNLHAISGLLMKLYANGLDLLYF